MLTLFGSVTEALIQATSEAFFGISRVHSTLAEILAVPSNGDSVISIPEGLKRQLECSSMERIKVIANGDRELLRDLLLGLNCDTEWDGLPQIIRVFLLERCCGESQAITHEQASWLDSRFCAGDNLAIEEHVARSNLGAILSSLVATYAHTLETHQYPLPYPEAPNKIERGLLEATFGAPAPSLRDRLKQPMYIVVRAVRLAIKFLIVALVADPEFQRELDFILTDQNVVFQWLANVLLNVVWLYCHALQQLILPWFMVCTGSSC